MPQLSLLKPRYPHLNAEHPQAKGLVLSWLFHEHGGNQINDLSGNQYNGALTGAWAIATGGSGAKTNGSTTEVVLTRTSGQTSPSIQIGDFTIAVKFTLSTLGSYTPVFDSYDSVSAGRNYSLFVNAGGGAAFVYWNVGSGAGTDGIAIGTSIAVNTWYDLVVTRAGSLSSFYINGKLGGTDSTQTGTVNNTTSTRTLSLGGNPSGGGTKEPFIYDYFALWNRALTPGAIEQLSRDPFFLYRPQQRRRLNSAAGGGITGTLAATEAGDTAAFTGTSASSGTLAATEAPDTAAITGTTGSTGTLAATEGADTAAISGTVSSGPSGTLAATEAPDAAAATGTTGSTGTLAATEAPDTAAISGFVGSATGTLAATESPDTAAFVGGQPAVVTQIVRVVLSYSPSLAIPEPSLFAPAGQRMVVTNFAGQPVAVAGNTGVKMIIDASKALGRSAPVSHVSLTLTETTGRDPVPGTRLSGSPTLVASRFRFQNIEQILVGLVVGGVYVASIGLFMSDGSSHRFAAPFFVPEE